MEAFRMQTGNCQIITQDSFDKSPKFLIEIPAFRHTLLLSTARKFFHFLVKAVVDFIFHAKQP